MCGADEARKSCPRVLRESAREFFQSYRNTASPSKSIYLRLFCTTTTIGKKKQGTCPRGKSTGPGQCHLLTGDKRPELRARLIARETLRCNFALRPVMRRGLMRPPRVINWRNTNTFVGSIWLLANANRIAPARVEEARPPPSPRACLAPLGRLARSVSRCKGAGPRNAMREDNRWHRV